MRALGRDGQHDRPVAERRAARAARPRAPAPRRPGARRPSGTTSILSAGTLQLAHQVVGGRGRVGDHAVRAARGQRHQHAPSPPDAARSAPRVQAVVQVVDRRRRGGSGPRSGRRDGQRVDEVDAGAARPGRAACCCSPRTHSTRLRGVDRHDDRLAPEVLAGRLAVDERGEAQRRRRRRAARGISSRATISMPPVSPGTRKTRFSADVHHASARS